MSVGIVRSIAGQPMSSAGLLVEDLSARHGRRPVLERVSFALDPGEILVVIGANGAGKTTLLETVVGALRGSSGKVSFAGTELATLRACSRVFSYMPDAAEPPAEVRVSALVDLVRRLQRVPDARARELAERLRLESFASARAGELSRGEKRRVLLFGALCTDRPVIVLDEPLGAFDPLQLRDVLRVMRDVAGAGRSFLLSVHQMSDAEKIASRVLILDEGRVVALGTLAELRARADRPEASLEEVFVRLLEMRRAAA